MLTKEECETALSKLWDNTFGTDCITGEDLDKYVDIIDGLIQYVFNPQPYKFEDLNVRMWVYDDKREFEDFRFIKIDKILSEFDCEHLYHDKNKKVFFDNISCHAREFEENRFYPVTKALEYQGKEDEND